MPIKCIILNLTTVPLNSSFSASLKAFAKNKSDINVRKLGKYFEKQQQPLQYSNVQIKIKNIFHLPCLYFFQTHRTFFGKHARKRSFIHLRFIKMLLVYWHIWLFTGIKGISIPRLFPGLECRFNLFFGFTNQQKIFGKRWVTQNLFALVNL